jgi:putative ABC transport system substrate-binding protein
MMDRRTFIGTAAGGLVAARLDAAVEPGGKVYRIGWLAFGATPSGPDPIDAFRRPLSELGWIEGQNIAIEAPWAANDSDRLTTQAAELVGLDRRGHAIPKTTRCAFVSFRDGRCRSYETLD